MKTVYTIDTERLLTGTRIADVDAMEPGRIVLMLNEVETKPLPEKVGFAVRHNEAENVWEYVEDHRGAVVFDTATGKQVTIEAVGPVSHYATQPKPSRLHEWNGKQWIITADDQAILDNEALAVEQANAVANVKALHDDADKELATLQYRVDLDRATAEHLARIKALKGFIIDLDDWQHPAPIPPKP